MHSVRGHLKWIGEATFSHSRKLALYVGFYKSFLYAIQQLCLKFGLQTESRLIEFISGSTAGILTFGSSKDPINVQIVYYLISRVSAALLSKFFTNYEHIAILSKIYESGFLISTFLVWGLVMQLFRFDSRHLHPSLRSSMIYLYEDCRL